MAPAVEVQWRGGRAAGSALRRLTLKKKNSRNKSVIQILLTHARISGAHVCSLVCVHGKKIKVNTTGMNSLPSGLSYADVVLVMTLVWLFLTVVEADGKNHKLGQLAVRWRWLR